MIPFVKMHGLGNDFVLVDGIGRDLSGIDVPRWAVQLCDRRRGAGADGLLLLEQGHAAELRMRMANPDGSASEMCGNGLRCLVRWANTLGYCGEEVLFETGAGVLPCRILEDGRVRVEMGRPGFTRREVGMAGDPEDTFQLQPIEAAGSSWTATAVATGNPHLVVFVEKVASIPLEEWGPALERHPWFPNRINVHFVEVASPGTLVQRTWERGAGPTLACGTGACASVAASFLAGFTSRQAIVRLPGGELEIEYDEAGAAIMTGPAEFVYEGRWSAMPPSRQ